MDSWREAELLADMAKHRADGVLVVAATGNRDAGADERMRELIAGGLRVVFIDRRPPGFDVDWVTSDNEQAGRLAGEELLAKGHKRIAFIWAHECGTFAARRRGLETALAARNLRLDPQLARGGWEPSSGYEGCGYLRTLELFHLPKPPTAILAGNDGLALGALRALQFLGRKVPRDVSVIGVDAIAASDPPLTGIRQDVNGMGLWAAEQLRRRIAGDASAPLVNLLPTELIPGGTVGPART
jgi:LacI family transcriptional regulator